uniref:Uncharacterized protein n=1 Tax=Neobodo designis TaxID=312471 RepID=A0A7S1KY39_NEODS|mmetsp:Transcript_11090/g.34375  ORF Transcript_11090/g.34375 Transcript_11090/m.34375 type:complete len:218 (+) Transcript_11090:34-687(+)
MLPQRNAATAAAAMDKLRGMKFMQRRQEQQRVEAHRAQLEQDRRGGDAAPAPEAAAEASRPAGPRIINASAIATPTAQYSKGRMAYGMLAVSAPAPAPPPPPAAADDDVEETDAVGQPDAPDAAVSSSGGARFTVQESVRAPPLPRRLERQVEGAERRKKEDRRRERDAEDDPRTRAPDVGDWRQKGPRAEQQDDFLPRRVAAGGRRDYDDDDEDDE